MIDDPSDHLLMKLIAKGDENALRHLIQRHQRTVYGTIYKMIGDASESEDLSQRVFLRIYQSASRYRPDAQFTTWLMTIIRNMVLNEYRRRQRKPWESIFDPETDEPKEFPDRIQTRPDQALHHSETLDLIHQALQKLPEKQRLAIILSRYHEMSYDEISQTLKISVAATKTLIFRGRETLKNALQKYL